MNWHIRNPKDEIRKQREAGSPQTVARGGIAEHLRTGLERSPRERRERGVYAASAWRQPVNVAEIGNARILLSLKRPEGRVPALILVEAFNTYAFALLCFEIFSRWPSFFRLLRGSGFRRNSESGVWNLHIRCT